MASVVSHIALKIHAADCLLAMSSRVRGNYGNIKAVTDQLWEINIFPIIVSTRTSTTYLGADELNTSLLKKVAGRTENIPAIDSSENEEIQEKLNTTGLLKNLVLKKGCRVIVTRAFEVTILGKKVKIPGGSFAEVQAIQKRHSIVTAVKLSISGGIVDEIVTLSTSKLFYDDSGEIWRQQFPLQIAYALCTRSCQGLTLKEGVCCLQNCFIPGELLTILNLFDSIDGLTILGGNSGVSPAQHLDEIWRNQPIAPQQPSIIEGYCEHTPPQLVLFPRQASL